MAARASSDTPIVERRSEFLIKCCFPGLFDGAEGKFDDFPAIAKFDRPGGRGGHRILTPPAMDAAFLAHIATAQTVVFLLRSWPTTLA